MNKKIFEKFSKTPYIIVYVILSILFVLGAGFGTVGQSLDNNLDSSLEIILKNFPEVQNKGERQEYFSEQVESNLYVGIGYIDNENILTGGDCFRVSNDSVQYIDSVKLDSSMPTEINPITCIAD